MISLWLVKKFFLIFLLFYICLKPNKTFKQNIYNVHKVKKTSMFKIITLFFFFPSCACPSKCFNGVFYKEQIFTLKNKNKLEGESNELCLTRILFWLHNFVRGWERNGVREVIEMSEACCSQAVRHEEAMDEIALQCVGQSSSIHWDHLFIFELQFAVERAFPCIINSCHAFGWLIMLPWNLFFKWSLCGEIVKS